MAYFQWHQQDPVLFYKWCVWAEAPQKTCLELKAIVELLVQLKTWLRAVSGTTPVFLLRLGTTPETPCHQMAFKTRTGPGFLQALVTLFLARPHDEVPTMDLLFGFLLTSAELYTVTKVWVAKERVDEVFRVIEENVGFDEVDGVVGIEPENEGHEGQENGG